MTVEEIESGDEQCKTMRHITNSLINNSEFTDIINEGLTIYKRVNRVYIFSLFAVSMLALRYAYLLKQYYTTLLNVILNLS